MPPLLLLVLLLLLLLMIMLVNSELNEISTLQRLPLGMIQLIIQAVVLNVEWSRHNAYLMMNWMD